MPGPGEPRAARPRGRPRRAGPAGLRGDGGHRRRGGAGQRGHRRRRQHATSTSSAASTSTRSGTRTRRSCARCRSRSPAVSVGSFTSKARVELAERLAAAPPAPGVHRLQLYSGGAEAVESALRLAKCHTGKYEFVSYWGGFHGKTMGALSLMGSTFKDKLGPMVPGAHQIPYADCYRCPVGLQYPSCGIACAEIGRKQVKTAGAGAVAAVIVEPMQGTAGNVIPPKEFLPAVRSLADERRRAADHRRDDHGARAHREALGNRPHRRASGRRHDRQGVRRRLPAVGAADDRRDRGGASRGATRRARRRATAATRWARRRARPRCASSTRRSWSRTRASSATC